MNLIFVVAILPPLFAIVAWTVVTVIRICLPERPLPFGNGPAWLYHHHMPGLNEGDLIGARDIRDDQRRQLRAHPPAPYAYCGLPHQSSGVPETWVDDVWIRRN